ncbi:MAG: hypothetical protein EZS28_048793 [Streblomastix strix]|uniref:Uncharacterized protein n=1 Tax=Streblomastix strix TaxID=222440 RepID=A0A5J4TDK6_9EUKA|nr:MAG: hypothetical protein EZS28_048793 [Streblomastix strix]
MLGRSEKGIRVSGLGIEFGKEGGVYSEDQIRVTEKEYQELDGMDEQSEKDQSENECSDLRRTELFQYLIRGFVFTSECNQQVENKSVEGSGLVRKIQFNEENQRRVGVVEEEYLGELTVELIGLGATMEEILEADQTSWVADRVWLKTMSQTSSFKRKVTAVLRAMERVVPDVDKQKDVIDFDGQCEGGICDQAMASQKGDVGNHQKDHSVIGQSGNRAFDEAYTWIGQSDGKIIKQIGEMWGLLNRLTGSRSSFEGAESENVNRRLCDQVENASENVLQPITR